MADLKISQLGSIVTVVPATDVLPVVQGATTYKVTPNQLLGAGGVATLASATITGDLTVRTNKLFVNATGVGIGNAGPLSALTVSSQTDARLSVRTTDAVFGSIAGGTALDSLNDAATVLVPFGCRGSTVSFAASGQNVGLQLDASSNVNVPLGNVVMGTSGKGIDFSATANGSGTMTSELLNDYEEGTWVGTIGGTTANPTTAVISTGRYTKIGRQVSIEIGFYGDTTPASGRITVSGLPFTSNASISRPGIIAMDTMGTFTGSPVAYLAAGVTLVDLYASSSNGSLSNVTHNAGAGRALYMALTYNV